MEKVCNVILNEFMNGDVYIDDYGIFISKSRKEIGDEVNICSRTATKYIKQLCEKGLIADVRRGLHMNNKIYLLDIALLYRVIKERKWDVTRPLD